MRRVVLTMLLAVAGSSAAAEWVWLGGNKIGIVYADPATIGREGSLVKMWDLMEYKATRTVGGKAYRSTRTHYEYDCGEGKSRLLDVIAYSEKMAGGEIVHKDERTRDWRPNLPDSGIEKLWKYACGK